MSEPWVVGPTWSRGSDGSFLLPDRSLGWGLFNWFYQYLRTPGGPEAGEPFLPTMEQARFLLWWYAVDESGRFVYRSGILRRMKGWGKDPLSGAIALAELCGPVEFDCFDSAGQAVGRPKFDPWVQIAAVSQEQTKNTFLMFPTLVSPQMKEEYGLELNKTVIYDGRGKPLEGVTSSPFAIEGGRPTFILLNETQWWLETNDGIAMKNVIDGNVTKSAYGSCRSLSICNAHIPGQGSVGEIDWDAYLDVKAGKAVDTGVLYDALEAPADTPVGEIPHPEDDPDGYAEGVERLRAGIEIAKGDARWLNTDLIIQSIFDRRNPVSESRRKFLNQVNAAEDAWISPAEWDSCPVADPLEAKDEVVLGFDGSKSDDHTALVACRVSDGAVFLLRAWDPSKFPEEEIDREVVDAYVRSAFERYRVIGMRADVYGWEAYIDAWARDFKRKFKVKQPGKHPIAFDMRGKKKDFALACERFVDAVLADELPHEVDPELRWYVMNACRMPTNYDAVAIRKRSKDSSRKIDAAVAAVLAFDLRQEFAMSRKHRSGRGGLI